MTDDSQLDDLESSESEDQSDEDELSLDQLSQAYAQLVDPGGDGNDAAEATGGASDDADVEDEWDEASDEEDSCEVTPRSIVEAILFVGTPDNSPLTNRRIAALMRGVGPREVDELIEDLNELYQDDDRPFRIDSVDAGYVMALCDEFVGLRDKFYGRIKEVRLSQAAVDVLAIVAYNQPMQREKVDQLRGRPSGKILNQLVKRQLLSVERPDEKPRTTHYRTTDRFLELFNLETVAQLPQSQDLEHQL